MITATIDKIFTWKSKIFSEESITTDSSFAPKLTFIHNAKMAVKPEANCLKQDIVSLTYVEFFIFYELDTCSCNLNTDLTLNDCLFGAVRVTKKADLGKYGYSGYGIGFDAHSQFSLKMVKLVSYFWCKH